MTNQACFKWYRQRVTIPLNSLLPVFFRDYSRQFLQTGLYACQCAFSYSPSQNFQLLGWIMLCPRMSKIDWISLPVPNDLLIMEAKQADIDMQKQGKGVKETFHPRRIKTKKPALTGRGAGLMDCLNKKNSLLFNQVPD
ncbi:MAG: hypothetical protein JST19_21675 [Bacteroidetes bacterium]|nr:hypothetical protein [Bacteroidota bacterium]